MRNPKKKRTDGNGPVHEDQVNVVGLELLQGLVHGLSNVLVVHVVNFGGQEEGLSGNTSILDTVSDFGFVSVGLSAVVRGVRKRRAGIPRLLTYQCACSQPTRRP